MAHVKHFKRCDIARLGHEWNRDRRADGSLMFRPTGEIDESRTPGNYQMERGRVANLLDKRLGQLTVSKRKDLNVVSTWVVTCPKELQGDPVKVRRFFEVTYGFIQDRYGRENVLNGFVHVDETSPHIHVPVVPVKDGRVSSKAVFTRIELSQFHKDLDEAVAREFGQKGLVVNGRTKGDYTVEELKERDRQEEALRLEHGNLKRQQAYIAQRRAEVDRRGLDVAARERGVEARERGVAHREQVVKAREKEVEQRETYVKGRERAVEALRDDFKQQEGKYLDELKALIKALKTPQEREAVLKRIPRSARSDPELDRMVWEIQQQARNERMLQELG